MTSTLILVEKKRLNYFKTNWEILRDSETHAKKCTKKIRVTSKNISIHYHKKLTLVRIKGLEV